jgi:hypothetical protein
LTGDVGIEPAAADASDVARDFGSDRVADRDGTLNRRLVLTRESPMEPIVPVGQSQMPGLRLDLLRQAVELYLKLAYPGGAVPDVVRRRLDWSEQGTTGEVVARPPFERAGTAPGRQTPIYALRLGNHRYPHMKLQIQPWANDAGFMLSVNTHDQVTGVHLGEVDALAFRDLQEENQRLKEAIERAWDEAGLPTFLRYLRDYIESRRGGTPGTATEDVPEAGPR